MHPKSKQQNNQTVVAKADRIEKELAANPELVNALLESGHFQAMVRHETSFSGPLPPPEIIRDYDQILPGGAERIFAMAEKEQAHRHEMDSTAVNGAIRKDKRGQWMGFSIAFIILAIASVFAWRGNTTFAGSLIAIDLLGLVSIFVLGRRRAKSDE
ncbi:DUF2335 domain-containing protein [Scandinavium manionii]|uniref:DUF2335 domain-containing protein n=1 Tax=Scandinavium manionii TaxID=2926520 RepID=UPI0021657CEA|nr:DUF2335 domain-containing protein [Scandinavium manionii]MCS2146891.1 DUF2335 domain-containing protein [Scandinavium manionii]